MKKKIFHVISNTHWDREWRFPFQRNRQMLVDMIDNVLEILKTEPQYRAFHLDSQAIVLRDYLEVRPHKEEELKKLIRQKRLLAGPWYILPEEFQVGGENLIRNLLLGHQLCNKLGGVSKIGYSPFSWGQISQLPQIYNQFGIELIMFYRGVNSIDSPKSEFLWRGADGTEAVSSRFSTMPRYNFYFYIYRPVVHNEGFSDVEYKWSGGGAPFHFADERQCEEDYFMIRPEDGYYPENLIPQVNKIISDQADDFTTRHVIWMEGHDSSGPNAKTVRIINDIKEKMPEIDVRHSTLEEYAAAVIKNVKRSQLKIVEGERRSSQFDRRSGNLYGYTTSARMYLKQKNFDAERWIQFYAEPFNVFSGLLGRNINDRYPEIAWELIIQNSAHDSIGGCSLDEIHEDMMNRYKQSTEISRGIFERAVKYISARVDTSVFDRKDNSNIFLVSINPNNYLRSEVVRAVIDIPEEFDKGSFKISDIDGRESEHQLISVKKAQPVLEQLTDRPMYFNMRRYEVYIRLNDVPRLGYKTFSIEPQKKNTSELKSIGTDLKMSLENEFLKIVINKNGTFNLTHKITGHVYRDQGYFYDEGEAGHAWVLKPVKPFINTLKSRPEIRLIENGPLSATFSVRHNITIHKTLSDRIRKSGKKVKIPVSLNLTLNKGSQHLEMNISVDNQAESHRLRIMFPSRLDIKYSYGEGQFDVVKRDVKRPDTRDWIEQPMYDYPLHQFADFTDDEKGFAVLSDGLKEYELLNDRQRTAAFTLLRAFEYVIQPSSVEDYSHQKGSQCPGMNYYRLGFFPHKGNWVEGNVYREALNFNNKIALAETGDTRGKLPSASSFLTIEPEEIVFSTFKKPEDGSQSFILRLYNPTEQNINGTVHTLFKIKKVTLVTLEEKPVNEIKLSDDHSFRIKINKKKINTYRIFFSNKTR